MPARLEGLLRVTPRADDIRSYQVSHIFDDCYRNSVGTAISRLRAHTMRPYKISYLQAQSNRQVPKHRKGKVKKV